jgi:hypothetical protein
MAGLPGRVLLIGAVTNSEAWRLGLPPVRSEPAPETCAGRLDAPGAKGERLWAFPRAFWEQSRARRAATATAAPRWPCRYPSHATITPASRLGPRGRRVFGARCEPDGLQAQPQPPAGLAPSFFYTSHAPKTRLRPPWRKRAARLWGWCGPDDALHLSAAIGWLELGNHIEANEDLEKITPDFREHPDVLESHEFKSWLVLDHISISPPSMFIRSQNVWLLTIRC